MHENLKELWQSWVAKLPPYLRNFFVVTALVFVFWMLFLDVDSIPRQIRRYFSNEELKEEAMYYQEKIKKGNEDLKGLKTDKDKLERFAREKYYMHKETEDVFVIDKQEEQD
jgi:cell division protein DivIC